VGVILLVSGSGKDKGFYERMSEQGFHSRCHCSELPSVLSHVWLSDSRAHGP